MSIFIKELIKRKINQLSAEEILTYGEQHGFSITKIEADKIETYIKATHIDPFNENDRIKMFQQLTEITNLDTAQKALSLFNEIIRSHGLEYLFNQ
jgi:hypothetical protein